jgi:hypothetical protein
MKISTNYKLVWDTYHLTNEPAIGGIYSNTIKVYSLDNWLFEISFTVDQNRTLGLLFLSVTSSHKNKFIGKLHYCLGQFNNNTGAKLFSQFALDHFINTETWEVCPSFEPVDYIDGIPYTLFGQEIVSDLI